MDPKRRNLIRNMVLMFFVLYFATYCTVIKLNN